jgi:WD40 repeat protein/tRNA A-37 threonylcarbamoyl transferase component Bud32
MRCRQCGTKFTLAASTDRVQPPPRPQATTNALEKLARFQVRSRLGAGAFGTVYRAFDPQLEREVALKVPQPGVLDNPKRVERFLREAKSAAQLQHPNIVPIFDAGQEAGHYYIASAFIQGHPLSDVISETTGLNPVRAAKIVLKLAEALAYAHQLGIVHRDIKPANVMIDDDDQPHLMDFGLAARTESTEKLTQDGAVLGTPAYMAPEHAAGHKGESFPESDQYSLGVVLYELLTGRTPWEGPPQIVLYNVLHKEPESPRRIRKDVPRDLETICLKAMAKKPEHRFRDCQALADDLRRWLEGEPIKARRPGFVERAVRWGKREPKLAAAGALAMIGLVALAVALAIVLQKVQADYGQEQLAHGKTKQSLTDTKQSLTDELADHRRTKGDRYAKQVGLANEQIGAFNLRGGMATLAACPGDLRGWEWGHLRMLAEGTPDAFHVLPGNGRVLHIAFSGDSKQLLSQHVHGTHKVWDLAAMKSKDRKQALALEEWAAVRFSADGKRVAEVQRPAPVVRPKGEGKDEPPPAKLVVREVDTNNVVREITIPGGFTNHALSPDGTKVAVASSARPGEPHKVVVFDVQSGEEVHKLAGDYLHVTELVFSGDGAMLAIVQGGATRATKKPVPVQYQEVVDGKTVTRTAFKEVMELHSTGGALLHVVELSSGSDKLAVKKDAVTGSRAVFAPDGARMYLLHSRGVDVYDLADGKEHFTLPGCAGAIAFSPDGKRLATAGCNDGCAADGLIHLWDAVTGGFIVSLRTRGYTNNYDTLLFSPDGAWLAAVPQMSPQVFLFGTSGGRLSTPYYDHGAAVATVTWSDDGTLISSWSPCNQTVHVWDATGGKTQLMAGGQFAAGLGFTTGGQYLATGGGCIGAAPYPGLAGHGCYGMMGGGSVNVFERGGFKAMPPPKGYDTILAASKGGKHWALRPSLPGGKPITADKLPKVRLWSPADDKEGLELPELAFGDRVEFTEDGSRVVGVGTGVAQMTGNTTEYRTETRTRKVKNKTKDGKEVETEESYTVQVPVTVPYTMTLNATTLKLLDADTGRQVWRSFGVDSVFAVSRDGKMVATQSPARPPQPQPPPTGFAAPGPAGGEKPDLKSFKQGPPPPPEPIAPAGEKGQGKAPIAPAGQKREGKAPSAPPSPSVSLWVVDEKSDVGSTRVHSLSVPGRVSMMRFSPDGKCLAVYLPDVVEERTEARTRLVTEMVDGKPVAKEVQYTVCVKHQLSMLKVFETATGKAVFTHRGASGVMVFCADSARIASAAGRPLFGDRQGSPIMMPGPAIDKKAAPLPPPKVVTRRPGSLHFVSVSQEPPLPPPVQLQPEPTPEVAYGMPVFDTAVLVFDLRTGKETHHFDGHTSQVTALAFGPDCRFLASGSYGAGVGYAGPTSDDTPAGQHYAQILIWDLGAKKLFQTIQGHTGRINCMEFDPEGKRLASASDDTTVMVWRVEASVNTTLPAPTGYGSYATPPPMTMPAMPVTPGTVPVPQPVAPTVPRTSPQER